MSPLTKKIPKALVDIAGKTLIERAIERYTLAGISDVVLAVGWKGKMVEDFVSRSKLDVRIVHVPSFETGPLQTLLSAIETFDGQFLLSPVDAIIDPASVKAILEHHSNFGAHEDTILAVSSIEESGTLVELGDNGLVVGIGDVVVNSKNVSRSAMMLISHTRIRELCKSTLENGHGRVVNLLEQMLRDGEHIGYFVVTQPWFDIDTLSDFLEANQYYLKQWNAKKPGSVFIPSGDSIETTDKLILQSKITIGKGTYLQGPTLLASNCEIGDHCKLGPNVTIASNTKVSAECELSNAVIFGDSKLSFQSRIHRSVVYDSIDYHVEE